jgi:hypothetical protein
VQLRLRQRQERGVVHGRAAYARPTASQPWHDQLMPREPEGLSEELVVVLHEARLRGTLHASAAAHAEHLGRLGYLHVNGTRGVLTARGRSVQEAWARVEAESETERSLDRLYRQFLPMNAELLRISTDWQVRPGNVPNDHSDARYDWSVIDRLVALDERAGPIVTRAGYIVGRFAAYRGRLRSARRKVEEGDPAWLVSPRCDSYHTVWMQLHEDLLLALGIERGDEAGP